MLSPDSWSTDLVAPGSIPANSNLANRKRDSIAHSRSLSLSHSHRLEMTKILLKMMQNPQEKK